VGGGRSLPRARGPVVGRSGTYAVSAVAALCGGRAHYARFIGSVVDAPHAVSGVNARWPARPYGRTARHVPSTATPIKILLSSQFWPMPSMSRGVINCAKMFLSHPFRRIKSFDQWAVDRDPVLTSTTSAKIGKTARYTPV